MATSDLTDDQLEYGRALDKLMGDFDKTEWATIVTALNAGTNLTDLVAASRNISTSGTVKFTSLPTADPHVAGQLWANSGVVTVSAG